MPSWSLQSRQMYRLWWKQELTAKNFRRIEEEKTFDGGWHRVGIQDGLECKTTSRRHQKLSMYICVSVGCVSVVSASIQVIAEHFGCMSSKSAD